MKPITEHSNLERGKRGAMIESFMDLGVLSCGLRHVSADTSLQTNVRGTAASLLAGVATLQEDLAKTRAKANVAGLDFSFNLPLVKEEHVVTSELAVVTVADNAPSSTHSPWLQDPLNHKQAITMWTEYQAALTALGGPPPSEGRPEPGA